jgi:hypothetical protein
MVPGKQKPDDLSLGFCISCGAVQYGLLTLNPNRVLNIT